LGEENDRNDPLQQGDSSMDASLRIFVSQLAGVVFAALVPVILVAFLSIPFSLGGHPGEARPASALIGKHMT
jgi:hypothetical protein